MMLSLIGRQGIKHASHHSRFVCSRLRPNTSTIASKRSFCTVTEEGTAATPVTPPQLPPKIIPELSLRQRLAQRSDQSKRFIIDWLKESKNRATLTVLGLIGYNWVLHTYGAENDPGNIIPELGDFDPTNEWRDYKDWTEREVDEMVNTQGWTPDDFMEHRYQIDKKKRQAEALREALHEVPIRERLERSYKKLAKKIKKAFRRADEIRKEKILAQLGVDEEDERKKNLVWSWWTSRGQFLSQHILPPSLRQEIIPTPEQLELASYYPFTKEQIQDIYKDAKEKGADANAMRELEKKLIELMQDFQDPWSTRSIFTDQLDPSGDPRSIRINPVYQSEADPTSLYYYEKDPDIFRPTKFRNPMNEDLKVQIETLTNPRGEFQFYEQHPLQDIVDFRLIQQEPFDDVTKRELLKENEKKYGTLKKVPTKTQKFFLPQVVSQLKPDMDDMKAFIVKQALDPTVKDRKLNDDFKTDEERLRAKQKKILEMPGYLKLFWKTVEITKMIPHQFIAPFTQRRTDNYQYEWLVNSGLLLWFGREVCTMLGPIRFLGLFYLSSVVGCMSFDAFEYYRYALGNSSPKPNYEGARPNPSLLDPDHWSDLFVGLYNLEAKNEMLNEVDLYKKRVKAMRDQIYGADLDVLAAVDEYINHPKIYAAEQGIDPNTVPDWIDFERMEQNRITKNRLWKQAEEQGYLPGDPVFEFLNESFPTLELPYQFPDWETKEGIEELVKSNDFFKEKNLQDTFLNRIQRPDLWEYLTSPEKPQNPDHPNFDPNWKPENEHFDNIVLRSGVILKRLLFGRKQSPTAIPKFPIYDDIDYSTEEGRLLGKMRYWHKLKAAVDNMPQHPLENWSSDLNTMFYSETLFNKRQRELDGPMPPNVREPKYNLDGTIAEDDEEYEPGYTTTYSKFFVRHPDGFRAGILGVTTFLTFSFPFYKALGPIKIRYILPFIFAYEWWNASYNILPQKIQERADAKFSVFSPELVGEVNVPEEILRNYILLVSNGSIDIKRWSKRDRQLKRYTVEDIFGQTTIHPGTFGASLVGVFMFVMMRRRGF